MRRNVLRLLALVVVAGGCSLPTTGGMAYDIDASKVGTGQQAVVPRNDGGYWDGRPMDNRPSR